MVTVALLLTVGLVGRVTRAETASTQPNILLILTDNQRFDELSRMSVVESQLVRKGMSFTRGYVVNPLCCPSRTSVLTGDYSHTTGVYTNGDGGDRHGGFPAFHDASTVATWLQGAGYATGLVGKYLNHYREAAQGGYVPPGWDTWAAFTGSFGSYYDYDMTVNGRIHHYGTRPSDYSTTVIDRFATSFIRGVPADQPLFLYWAPAAPHSPAIPPPGAASRIHAPVPRRPGFNESNVSDKPAYVRSMPRVGSGETGKLRAKYDDVLGTLVGVDRAVGDILDALRTSGRLSNTMIVFMSDNGMSMGEHRWTTKLAPYEESTRVPLVIRWDGTVPPGRRTSALAANIDLAPTWTQAAGIQTPGSVEGSR